MPSPTPRRPPAYGWALLLSLLFRLPLAAQAPDPWRITANKVDPGNYYGVTVANGMIGLVSSPVPFQLKNVVLAGAYDQYGRGRVSKCSRRARIGSLIVPSGPVSSSVQRSSRTQRAQSLP